MNWTFYYGATEEWLGFIPMIILDSDKRPVAEQVAERYAHGGGWKPLPQGRFKMQIDSVNRPMLSYPGDPPLRMWASTVHGNEQIMMFESSWMVVKNLETGAWQASRID